MHKQISAQDNEMLWDFEIQTDHQNPAMKPDLF